MLCIDWNIKLTSVGNSSPDLNLWKRQYFSNKINTDNKNRTQSFLNNVPYTSLKFIKQPIILTLLTFRSLLETETSTV